MRKINIVITAFFVIGLLLFVLGRSGYGSKMIVGLEVISYGGFVSFTCAPEIDEACYFAWLPEGWTVPYGPITYGYSSTWGVGPMLNPGDYSVTCEYYYFYIPYTPDPNPQDLSYADLHSSGFTFIGFETFTWTVLPPETPTPTPSPPPSPTPTLSYPTPTPSSTPTPTPTTTPTTYYTVTYGSSPSAGGTVTKNPAGPNYAAGSTVTLTAIANSGYQFDHWQETSPYVGALYSNPLSFTIDTNYAFTAVFTQLPASTSTPSPSGSPNPDATPTATPLPTPTLAPPPSLPPPEATPTPTPSASPKQILANNINQWMQIIGLAMAILSAVAFLPANPNWLSSRK